MAALGTLTERPEWGTPQIARAINIAGRLIRGGVGNANLRRAWDCFSRKRTSPMGDKLAGVGPLIAQAIGNTTGTKSWRPWEGSTPPHDLARVQYTMNLLRVKL